MTFCLRLPLTDLNLCVVLFILLQRIQKSKPLSFVKLYEIFTNFQNLFTEHSSIKFVEVKMKTYCLTFFNLRCILAV